MVSVRVLRKLSAAKPQPKKTFNRKEHKIRKKQINHKEHIECCAQPVQVVQAVRAKWVR
jgi:hypothetical protein